ncbi:serine/threonine protein kinase [Cohnella silvisoli]|uniref:non-specific serine/threonine protein kinase n=1 Tax=Cohnella silvisoli TaxID=2873699 RepID=A0ABV1KNV9_9BACL|nr:serine/threonine-protein kinase [Cohnella silvisoli]MCD9020990.1 serine/threonine protein kinase [Cohnella silvisoli]
MNNERLAGLELRAGELYGDRYRIVMPIGKGGMGRVYLAEDTRLGGKTRALKLMCPLPDEARSFLLEAQLLSELDHPHLPDIVDYFPPNETGVAGIVMDYIAGDTLTERFDRYGRNLPFNLVLKILIQLCEVLIYLHAQSPAIVFRDLKPSNVLLDRHNNAILVDFGIARRYREESQKDTLQLGTPGFAAPEQLRGEQSDTRTDIYGLGALAYHLLSGGQFAIRHRGVYRKALQDDVPTEFALLLERILAIDPQNRPQSANELYSELKIMQHGNERSNDSNHVHQIANREGVIVIAIASAYPGAGATFASLALSSSLSRSGISHALVECPGGEPELYALLHGDRKMPRGAVYAESDGLQASVPAWRDGKAAYYPLNPKAYARNGPDAAFAQWLRRLGVPVVLLDVSSGWEKSELTDWIIRSVDRIGIVADCYPVKWSSRRQVACEELLQSARQRNIRSGWIANRDQSFPERKQWLSLFPTNPDAYLPDFSGKLMLNSLWRGEGLPSDPCTLRALDEAFHSLIRKIISSFD